MAVHLAGKRRVNWQRKRINSPGRCTMRSRVRPTQKPPSGNQTCTQFRWIERSIPCSVCIPFFLFFFLSLGVVRHAITIAKATRERERGKERRNEFTTLWRIPSQQRDEYQSRRYATIIQMKALTTHWLWILPMIDDDLQHLWMSRNECTPLLYHSLPTSTLNSRRGCASIEFMTKLTRKRNY